VRLIGDARANLILYGHIHYASSGTVHGQRLTSIGATGFPFDRDQRAAYALVTWDGSEWRVTHRRVAYDVQAAIAEARASGAPFAQLAAGRLQYAVANPPS
jgi:diadenosine tetraphosphatase ApaH/serine/threonine PP2A family protein phosphatase